MTNKQSNFQINSTHKTAFNVPLKYKFYFQNHKYKNYFNLFNYVKKFKVTPK